MLEDTTVDITNAETSSRTAQTSRENEMREQMQHANATKEKYTGEIVAHAESIKVVDIFMKEFSKAWTQLNKEIADLTARCIDLAAQHSLLHKHLDSVSSQAFRTHQAAHSNMNVPESCNGDDVDDYVAEPCSVVAYLRKENEIVDLELELSRTTLSNDEREEVTKAITPPRSCRE
ncbi:MLP1_4 [Sanghuangporus vaninii]